MFCFTLQQPALDFKALQSYLEVIYIISALFFLCYCGTELSEASQSIASACYEADFIGTDIRFQKSLIFIMMRSQRPAQITVGKFTGLSIAIFTLVSLLFILVLKDNFRFISFCFLDNT